MNRVPDPRCPLPQPGRPCSARSSRRLRRPTSSGFSAKHHFPNEWYRFLNPPDTQANQQVTLDLTKERFAFRLRNLNLKIKKVGLFLKLANRLLQQQFYEGPMGRDHVGTMTFCACGDTPAVDAALLLPLRQHADGAPAMATKESGAISAT
jgi:hypothetical protein